MSFKRKCSRKGNKHVGKNAVLYGNRFERRGYLPGTKGTKFRRDCHMCAVNPQAAYQQ